MRATTKVTLALRNVGDSSDSGTIIEGTLKEMVMEIAKYLGGRDMKKRFVMCVARNNIDAAAGIRIKGDPSESEQSLLNDLAALMGESDETDSQDELFVLGETAGPVPAAAKIPGDDWVDPSMRKGQ